jgi:hypothetical protein
MSHQCACCNELTRMHQHPVCSTCLSDEAFAFAGSQSVCERLQSQFDPFETPHAPNEEKAKRWMSNNSP